MPCILCFKAATVFWWNLKFQITHSQCCSCMPESGVRGQWIMPIDVGIVCEAGMVRPVVWHCASRCWRNSNGLVDDSYLHWKHFGMVVRRVGALSLSSALLLWPSLLLFSHAYPMGSMLVSEDMLTVWSSRPKDDKIQVSDHGRKTHSSKNDQEHQAMWCESN